jgi:rfaE bifunctional protein kinase chain/domain
MSTAPTSDLLSEDLVHAVRRDIAGHDAIVLSDYAKGALTAATARAVVDAANEAGVPVVVDCKPAHAEWFAGATIVAPNDLEANQLMPGFQNSMDKRRYVEALHRRFGARNTVVTLGATGICGWDGTAFYYVEAHAVDVVDAVGAGDTVRAAMALGVALRLPLPEILAVANDIAAVSVQKPGTATVRPDDLIRFLNRGAGADRHVARH